MTSQELIVPIGNTGYGAVELKKLYQKFFRRGLEYAIIVHIILISSYLLANYISKLKAENLVKQQQQQRIINLTDLEPPPSATEDETPPPKQIEQIQSAPPKDLTALTPEPVAKEKAEEQTIKTQNELEQIKTPVSSMGDTGKFTYSGPIKVKEDVIEKKIEKEEKKSVEKETYKEFEVEKPPECINLGQVRSSMSYPEVARSSGIEGKVTVKVLVGPDGNVIKVGSLSGPDVFYEEVSNKCMDLQFTPGLQNGKPVKVWVTVPFNFKLKNQ
ncbi:MAG: energy transducer TonB [Ignavibacteria bacterium]